MDKDVRGVFFDPRCGWVLISNGVYLGTSRVLTRAGALRELRQREIKFGLREKNTDITEAQTKAYRGLTTLTYENDRKHDAARAVRREAYRRGL